MCCSKQIPNAVVALALLLAIVAPATRADEKYEPGRTYFGRQNYIEYRAGSLPFIISAPHGGRDRPDELPNREQGVFAHDTNTQELARALADELFKQTGRPAHLVICRIHRIKLDCNREIVEAAAGNELAERTWNEYHKFLDVSRAAVVAEFKRGLLVDLHGHAHREQRIEIGYLHSQEELQAADAELNRPEFVNQGSLKALVATADLSYAELLRGKNSFGGLLERHGFPATPSPQTPRPPQPYFRGGFITQRHSRDAHSICGMQLETNWRGVRDNPHSRAAFARAVANSMREFSTTHLKIQVPAK